MRKDAWPVGGILIVLLLAGFRYVRLCLDPATIPKPEVAALTLAAVLATLCLRVVFASSGAAEGMTDRTQRWAKLSAGSRISDARVVQV